MFIACAHKKFAYWVENGNAMNMFLGLIVPNPEQRGFFLFYHLDRVISTCLWESNLLISTSNWLVYTVKSNVIGPFIKPNATIGMDERKQFNYTKVNIVHVYVIAVSASVFRTGITAETNWICVIHFDAMVYRWNLGKSIDED